VFADFPEDCEEENTAVTREAESTRQKAEKWSRSRDGVLIVFLLSGANGGFDNKVNLGGWQERVPVRDAELK
jgi:hypothetical protein